jgi:hypothetical protein
LGVNETVAHHYLHRHQGDMGWVLTALVGATPPPSHPPPPREWKSTFHDWADGQKSYFTRRSEQYASRARTLERASRSSFYLAIALTIVDLPLLALHRLHVGTNLQVTISVATGLSFVVSGLTNAYSEAQSTQEDTVQYRRMRDLFDSAARECDKLIDTFPSLGGTLESGRHPSAATIYELLTNTALRVGKEALRENADWTLVHVAHQPKMPTG